MKGAMAMLRAELDSWFKTFRQVSTGIAHLMPLVPVSSTGINNN